MTKLTTGEHLVKLQTDIEYIKLQLVDNNSKIEGFINKANKTYADKQEVQVLKDKVDSLSLSDEAQWQKLVKIGERLALLSVLLYFLLKESGVEII